MTTPPPSLKPEALASLVERLNNPGWSDCNHHLIMEEAATTIETLEADVAALRDALEGSQLGLTVLANMLKRIGCKKGEAVAVETHRQNATTLERTAR